MSWVLLLHCVLGFKLWLHEWWQAYIHLLALHYTSCFGFVSAVVCFLRLCECKKQCSGPLICLVCHSALDVVMLCVYDLQFTGGWSLHAVGVNVQCSSAYIAGIHSIQMTSLYISWQASTVSNRSLHVWWQTKTSLYCCRSLTVLYIHGGIFANAHCTQSLFFC